MALAGNLRTKLLTHTFVGRGMLNATGTIAVVGLDGSAKLFDLLFCPAGVCNNFHVKAFLHTD
jgi:hypothetical protein